MFPSELRPEIQALTEATNCFLLIRDEREIRDIEAEAKFAGVQGEGGA